MNIAKSLCGWRWWKLIPVFLLALGCATRSTPLSHRSTTIVTFVRHEDNGIVNIQPADVIIDGRLVATISGGETRDISVSLGEHTVSAQSANPYEPRSNRKSWGSKPLKIWVRPAHRIFIFIEPESKDSEYTGG